MSPRYLRYRFPSVHASESAGLPVESARALAHLFLEVPPEQRTVARLDSIATSWVTVNSDAGALDYTHGEPMGEEIAPWLRIVVGPGGRRVFLDVCLDNMTEEADSIILARRRLAR